MSSDDGSRLAFLLLAILLPLSALLSRRLPLKRSLLMALAWIGIILVLMIGIGLARENGVRQSWAHLKALLSDDEQRVTGSTVRLRAAPDGHFWATATINGINRRMLIDTGATETALSLATARTAGLDLDQSPFPAIIVTANGKVAARTSRISRFALGPIVAHDLRVMVASEFGDTDVLGMNFLSRLKSWRVEGDMLVLEPNS